MQDLSPEAAMGLTLFGIYGLGDLPYDDALNLSRSLTIGLENHSAGYHLQGRMIGVNPETQVQVGIGHPEGMATSPLWYVQGRSCVWFHPKNEAPNG